ncbi:MAG: LamG-like jellyroll fold domain-containing protein [Patescibacteria group bacterium]
MIFLKHLHKLTRRELHTLGGLCAGTSFLLFVALGISGNFPNLPESLKLVLSQQGNAQTATVYNSSTSYTVPPGVTSVYVQVYGAGGGNDYSSTFAGSCGGYGVYINGNGPGASGGYTNGMIPVTPGQVLSVVVGTVNGGGAPGAGPGYGGGYSGVFDGNPQQSTALMVAGGGGGAGRYVVIANYAGYCGIGNAAGSAPGAGGGANGAGTGVLTGGGAGGYGGGGGAGYYGGAGGQSSGTNGSGGAGGSGYCAPSLANCTTSSGGGAGAAGTGSVSIVPSTAVLSISATPQSVAAGGTSNIAWNATGVVANSCTISSGQGPLGSQGLGTDVSGNGSHFALGNISAQDQVSDTPTNSFATLNQIYYSIQTYSKGTVQDAGLAANGGYGAATGWQLTSGKWYWEYAVQPGAKSGGWPIVGVFKDTTSGSAYRLYPGHNNDDGIGYGADGTTYFDTGSRGTLASFTAGDVIGVAYDADTGKVYFSKNGTWQNSGNPTAGTGYLAIVKGGYPGLSSYYGKTIVNFGQLAAVTSARVYSIPGIYAYAVPVGYSSITVSVAGAGGGGTGGTAKINCDKYNNCVYQPGSAGAGGTASAFYATNASGGGGGGVNGGASGGDTNTVAGGASGGAGGAGSGGTGGVGGNGGLAVKTYGVGVLSGNIQVVVGSGGAGGGGACNAKDKYNNCIGYEPAGAAGANGAVTIQATGAPTTGGGNFYFPPPSGYNAISTANLPAPAVAQPANYFGATTYTGTGQSPQTVGGLNFAPDLVWIKNRAGAFWNTLSDTTRGPNSDLFSNSTSAATPNDANGWLSSFSTNSFAVGGQCSALSGNTNLIGNNYISWAWKKSPTSGMDIVSYTGDGTSNRSIAHALGTTPDFIMVKRTDNTGDWFVWSSAMGSNNYLKLNTQDAASTVNSPWGVATMSTTNFTVTANATNNANLAGANYVAYLFSNRDGFQKSGSYVGNGTADGPVIYTGFKPKFVMIRSLQAGNLESLMYDSSRDTSNPATHYISAGFNSTGVELTSSGDIDILSNGFKVRNTTSSGNNSGQTFVYIAFADVPFKSASAANGYSVPNSARFDASNNAYLSHTNTAVGATTKGTVSFWMKRGSISGSRMNVLSAGNNAEMIGPSNDSNVDTLWVRLANGSDMNFGGTASNMAKLRDPTAWDNIVVAWDTTQATAANRVHVYRNGIEQPLVAGTYPAQNATVSLFNSGVAANIGRDIANAAYYFDGNLADFYAVDGSQLTPSSFGAADSNGFWKPKAYSGTYGTNGFYFNFQNALNMGADASGRGNNFTPNNISAVDQMPDTPTDNYATLNQNNYYSGYPKGVVQGGGLAANGNYGTVADWQLTTGKWYWENVIGGSNGGWPMPGVFSDPTSAVTGRAYPGHSNDYGFGYFQSGTVYSNGSPQPAVVSPFNNGDIIGVAYDADTGKVYFSKNGVWQNNASLNLIPTMTGQTTSGVTITDSTEYSTDYSAWRTADRNSGSGWDAYPTPPSVAAPQWMRTDFGASNGKTVGSYSIQIWPAVGSYDPLDFALEGSNDSATCSAGNGTAGSTWTILDIETNALWSYASQAQTFSVPVGNQASYRCYRLKVTRSNGNSQLLISEFGLYVATSPNPAVDGSVSPVGTVTNGWPGLASYYGKTTVNFGQGSPTTLFGDASNYGRVLLPVVGQPTPSGTIVKLGSASGFFNGLSALTSPQSSELNMSGDYTIDLWAYPTSLGTSGGLVSRDYSAGYTPYLVYQSGSTFTFYSSAVGGDWSIASAQPICTGVTINTWYHLAVVRSGNTYRTFCNGTQTATWSSAATPWAAPYPLVLGRQATGGPYFVGYLDEVRISNTARWTSNFTPPTSAYSSDANTLFLAHMDNERSSFYKSASDGYFAYTPPSGYKALSTNNLAAPAIAKPSNYFDAKAYSGSGGSPSFDPINKDSFITLSNNNFDANSSTNTYWNTLYGTNSFSAGKWYAEFKIGAAYSNTIGIGDATKRLTGTASQQLGQFANEYAYNPENNRLYSNNVITSGYPTVVAGDVVMVAVDMDAGLIWFGKNGAWFNSGNPATGTGAQFTGVTGSKVFAASLLAGDGTLQAEFGQSGRPGSTNYPAAGGNFWYQPPTGFSALAAQGGAQEIGLSFQPDLVWIKNRTTTYWNTLVDSLRGAGRDVFSNSTSAQTFNDTNGTVSAFTPSGFTVGGSCTGAGGGNVNTLNSTYSAWLLKESPAAGFDIVSYTGNGTTNRSVAQALGTTPDFIITKAVNAIGDWFVYDKAMGESSFAKLNTTDAQSEVSSPFSIDLIPKMTAVTTNGVTMSGGGNSGVCEYQAAWHAGDKIVAPSDYWDGYNSTTPSLCTPSISNPVWLKVDFGTAKTATAYSISSFQYPSVYYDPIDFTLQGSNDNTAWTTLDTQTSVGWTPFESKTFTVATPGSYRYYRVSTTRIGAGGNEFIIQELHLYGAGTLNTASNFVVSGALNTASTNYISYLFSNREGVLKSGIYNGNNSTDGPFIYTGFKPKWVMIKDVSTGNAYTHWSVYDSARDPSNPLTKMLYPDAALVEGNDGYCSTANCPIDFLANGFKVRSGGYWNTNYQPEAYAYIAFADVPFKESADTSVSTIPYALRFSANNSDYLSHNFALASTDAKKGTVSFWLKRAAINGGWQFLYGGSGGIYLDPSDHIRIYDAAYDIYSTQTFRDPSQWIHFVFAFDSTAAAGQRVKAWANNVPLTFTAYAEPAANAPFNILSTGARAFGMSGGTNYPLDGYLAEANVVDGLALDPSSFGQYDANGVWKPATYGGQYGVNGFHLNFATTAVSTPTNSGNVTVGPLFNTSTYTLQCQPLPGEGSGYLSKSTTVTVSPNLVQLSACNSLGSCSTNSASSVYITPNTSALLSWNAPTADANSCTVTSLAAGVSGTISPANTNSATNVTSPAVNANTTYTLTCQINGTPATASAAVSVQQACASSGSTLSCANQCVFTSDSVNAPATLSWCCPTGSAVGTGFSTGGATKGSTNVTDNGTYGLQCPTGSGSVTLAGVAPAVTNPLVASPTRVRKGGTTSLSWSVNSLSPGTSCSITPALSNGMAVWDGSGTSWTGTNVRSLPINSPTKFTLTCTNGSGTVSASASVGLLPTFQEI